MTNNRVLVEDTPPVALRRTKLVHEPAVQSVQTKLVADLPIAPETPRTKLVGERVQQHVRTPHTSSVRLGDVVGDQLREISRALRDVNHRVYKLEETIHTSACFIATPEHGRYTRPRKIEVGYKRSAKPSPDPSLLAKLSETLRTTLPIIRYPEGECFGLNPFLELTDDTYRTTIQNESGEDVEICCTGMELYMERKKEEWNDSWVYWPYSRDRNPQNFPVCGKVTMDLSEAHFFDPPREPILRAKEVDSDFILLAIEVIQEFDAPTVLLVVRDKQGIMRVQEISHDESLFA